MAEAAITIVVPTATGGIPVSAPLTSPFPLADLRTTFPRTSGWEPVYWHFADKTALLKQVLHQQPLPLECLNAQSDLRQDCARMTRAVLATTCTSPHRQIVTILTQRSEWDYAEDVVRRRILLARKRFMAFLEQMLCGAQRRGELPGVLGEDAIGCRVAAIQSAVSGVVFESLLMSGRHRHQRIAQTLQLLLFLVASGSQTGR